MKKIQSHSNNESKPQQNDVVSLVDQIFQNISNNKQIPATIEAELVKLKSSYLNIALETPNLFRLDNHQARLFLNSVIATTVEQNAQNSITESFVKKIESLVKQILKLKQYDNKLFVKFQTDLERFIKRQIKRAEVKKKREYEKQQGQKKIIQAKQSAKQILEKRIINKKLPKFVKRILIDDWFNVLVLFNLRYNPKSKEYQENLAFIDMLVEYLHAESQLSLSQSKILFLSKKYQNGLELVAFNSTESKTKSKELELNINRLIKSRLSNKDKEHIAKAVTIKPEDILNKSCVLTQQNKENIPEKKIQQIKSKKTEDTDYSKLIDSFKKGDWFEIFNGKNKYIKAKLSWISPISAKYLFVDLNGLKLKDQTKAELLECLNNKTIKVINTKQE